MKRISFALVAAVTVGTLSIAVKAEDAAPVSAPPTMLADGAKSQEGATDDNGKWMLPDGSPTYHIQPNGKLDWYTYSGFRRYHSECHVCHGPEGEGSTYAPALAHSLKTMSYADFLGTVASGRTANKGGTNFVMPAFGDNKNVMCYVDDIYSYLRARSDGALARGRPTARDDKPKRATDHDKECFGS